MLSGAVFAGICWRSWCGSSPSSCSRRRAGTTSCSEGWRSCSGAFVVSFLLPVAICNHPTALVFSIPLAIGFTIALDRKGRRAPGANGTHPARCASPSARLRGTGRNRGMGRNRGIGRNRCMGAGRRPTWIRGAAWIWPQPGTQPGYGAQPGAQPGYGAQVGYGPQGGAPQAPPPGGPGQGGWPSGGTPQG